MKIYRASDEWCQVEPGNTAILGFQQVLTNPDKVFVWVRGSVNRPKSVDRHKTTKMANNSYQKLEWAKSVWLIERVWEHFGKRLAVIGVTKQKLYDLSNEEVESDIWETRGDGSRNFVKALLMNPMSEVTGEPVAIQVTQYEGDTPDDIVKRAFDEAVGDTKRYMALLAKYRDKALVRTYVPTAVPWKGMLLPGKKLVEVYTLNTDGSKMPIYETNEITLGEPHHVFIDYIKPNLMPKDTLTTVVSGMEKSTGEQLKITDERYKITEEAILEEKPGEQIKHKQ